MGETEISWTHRPGTVGRTWNFTRGCYPISEGCLNCYAMKLGGRFCGPGKPYHGLVQLGGKRGPMWTGEGSVAVGHLVDPFTWSEPSTAFVNSMSDLWFEKFEFEEIAAGFAVMALTPEHTYQILTKRPERAVEFFRWLRQKGRGETMNEMFIRYVMPLRTDNYWARRLPTHDLYDPVCNASTLSYDGGGSGWPLPNVWVGISAENQTRYNQRLPRLLEMDGILKFISFEPLLGPIDPDIPMCPACNGTALGESDDGTPWCAECGTGEEAVEMAYGWWNSEENGVRWAIFGAESGPRSRPCDPNWVRDLIKHCEDDNVVPFVKQLVENQEMAIDPTGACSTPLQSVWCGPLSERRGRGHGGDMISNPYLDGKQYVQWPTVPGEEEESDAA